MTWLCALCEIRQKPKTWSKTFPRYLPGKGEFRLLQRHTQSVDTSVRLSSGAPQETAPGVESLLHWGGLGSRRRNSSSQPIRGELPETVGLAEANRCGVHDAFRRVTQAIKLKNGLTSSRVQRDLRRPRSTSVHAQTRRDFPVDGWAEAHANSKLLHQGQ